MVAQCNAVGLSPATFFRPSRPSSVRPSREDEDEERFPLARSLAPPRTLSWIDCHQNHDDSVLETFHLSIAALLWSRSCCNYCCCFCCCCCWIVVIPNKLFLGFLVGTSKKSLNEFPLMQNPGIKWNGLVGWFVCLFVWQWGNTMTPSICFTMRKFITKQNIEI